MKIGTIVWAGLVALPLIVSAPVVAMGFDRETGPAGAAGVGNKHNSALNRHSQNYGRGVRNVSGNEEFRRPARQEPKDAPAERNGTSRPAGEIIYPDETPSDGE